MKILEFNEIINVLNLDIIKYGNKIRTPDNEAYYEIRFDNQYWNICFIQRGIIKIKYSYRDESEALEKFIIVLIKEYIIKNFVYPCFAENPIIYDVNFSYKDIRNIYNEEGIINNGECIYHLKLIGNNLKKSICIINTEGKEIYSTNEMESYDAMFVFFQWGIILHKYISISNQIKKINRGINILTNEKVIELFMT